MDLITHTLLGAATARLSLNRSRAIVARTSARRLVMTLGAAGAFVPDLDFLLRGFSDPAFPIELHRHFTHAIVFIPFGGLIAFLPFLALRSVREHWRLALIAAIIGCASHALLDCCTSYGTLWLWPFSREYVAWDLIAVIDPLFTIPLMICVIIAWRRRTVRPAAWAFIWCAFYVSVGFMQRERALSAQSLLAASRTHHIERGRAFPTLGNNLFWRSVYLADGQLWADGIILNTLGSPRIDQGESMPNFTRDDLPASIAHHPRVVNVFDKFAHFSNGYTAAFRDHRINGGLILMVGDMRYSRSFNRFEPIWGIRIEPDQPPYVEWVVWRSSAGEGVNGAD